MIAPSLTQRLLANQQYHIEFYGFLSNHVKHAIVALDKLHAPDSRIQEYWDEYTTSTPYNIPIEKVEEGSWKNLTPTTRSEWVAARGKKEKWQEMVLMLDQQQEANTIKELVQEFAPDILNGLAGGLTHGIVHLGWAIDADSPWMVKEGLAYLNFCHVPIGPKLESGAVQEESPIESLERFATQWHADDLDQKWVQPTKEKYDESFHPELVAAGFQWQLAKVLHDAHPSVTQMPSWLQTKSLNFDVEADSVWEALYRAVTLLFLATRDENQHGNFVVLHFLSSLWGLEQVCRLIDDEQVIRSALETYWCTGLCLMATTGKVPTSLQLQQVLESYGDPKAPNKTNGVAAWEDVVDRGIAEAEEHNIKLVYVMQELWKKYGKATAYFEAARSFTLTPNIGPTSATAVPEESS